MHRRLKNKSLENYTPKSISEDKKIDIFAEFLVEVVAIYGFIGGYAIYEFVLKHNKDEAEKLKQ